MIKTNYGKNKISTGSSSLFFRSLDKEVDEMIERNGLLKKARKNLYIKTFLYTAVCGNYSSLYLDRSFIIY
jgi:hypothetical protein